MFLPSESSGASLRVLGMFEYFLCVCPGMCHLWNTGPPPERKRKRGRETVAGLTEVKEGKGKVQRDGVVSTHNMYRG